MRGQLLVKVLVYLVGLGYFEAVEYSPFGVTSSGVLMMRLEFGDPKNFF